MESLKREGEGEKVEMEVNEPRYILFLNVHGQKVRNTHLYLGKRKHTRASTHVHSRMHGDLETRAYS